MTAERRSPRPGSLLQVDNLTVDFRESGRTVHVLRRLSLSVREGEIVGIVGESGAGKSVLARAILGMLPVQGRIVDGAIMWRGRNIGHASSAEISAIRGAQITMVFQNAQSALDPTASVRDQLMSVLRMHERNGRGRGISAADELLDYVGFPPDAVHRRPHELSGGMCQRAVIAMALACEPALIVGDEPTSGLDMVAQDRILRLLVQARDQLGMTVMLISHDLPIVAEICDQVGVIYQGAIVEHGPTLDVFRRPQHRHTRALLAASPRRLGARGGD